MTRWRVRLIGIIVLALVLGPGASAQGVPSLAALTVRIAGGATRTTLHLQPGFATVIRADHRIDTVAIGDPRLVTATTVKRGQDVYDLVLQPQTPTGTTNMVVWFGDLTAIWELVIGPGQRTADIIYVVTAAGAVRPPASPSAGPPAPDSIPTPAAPGVRGSEHGRGPSQVVEAQPSSRSAPGGPPRTDPRLSSAPPPPPTGPAFIESRQTVGDLVGMFKILRALDRVVIRYRITNNGEADLAVKLSGVLVRVNGRLVPFGLARDGADRDRPSILPRGATETGVLDVPGTAPRQVELIFSLFPVGGDNQGPGAVPPLTFQPMFAGVDRLVTSPTP